MALQSVMLFVILACFCHFYASFSVEEEWAFHSSPEQVLNSLVSGSEDHLFYQILLEQNKGDFADREKSENLLQRLHSISRSKEMELRDRQIVLDLQSNRTEALPQLLARVNHVTLHHERDSPVFQHPQAMEEPHSIIGDKYLPSNTIKESKWLLSDLGLSYLLQTEKLTLPMEEDDALELLEKLPSFENLPVSPIAVLRWCTKKMAQKGDNRFFSNLFAKMTLKQMKDLSEHPDLFRNQEITFIQAFAQKVAPTAYESSSQAVHDFYEDMILFLEQLDINGVHRFSSYRTVQLNFLQWQLTQWNDAEIRSGNSNDHNLNHIIDQWVQYLDTKHKYQRTESKYFSSTISFPNHPWLSLINQQQETQFEKKLLHLFHKRIDDDSFRFAKYFSKPFLSELRHECVLAYGSTSSIDNIIGEHPELLQTEYPMKLEIEASSLDLQHPYPFHVTMQGIETVRIRAFEVNPFHFYQQNPGKSLIVENINVDGLFPHFEQFHEYRSIHPAQIIQRRFTFPELKQDRSYLIEWTSNDQTSRVLIPSSSVRFTHRVTAYGHSFYVFDSKTDEMVRDASIYLSSFLFKAVDGEIVIPFHSGDHDQLSRAIVSLPNGYAEEISFLHKVEIYDLALNAILDYEQLQPGSLVSVLLQPSLSISDVTIPLQLVESSSIIVQWFHEGQEVSREYKDISLANTPSEFLQDWTLSIRQPLLSVDKVSFQMNAGLRGIDGELRALKSNQNVLGFGTEEVEIFTWYIRQLNDFSWQLQLLGRAGEPIRFYSTVVELTHILFRNPIRLEADTDSNGCITILSPLGSIENIQTIRIPGSTTFQVAREPANSLEILYVDEKEPIFIPWRTKQTMDGYYATPLFSISSLNSASLVEDYTHHVEVNEEYFMISNLPAGLYRFSPSWNGGQAKIYSLHVLPSPHSHDDFLVTKEGFFPNSHALLDTSLLLESIEVEDDLILRFRGNKNAAPSRVHIVGNQFQGNSLASFENYQGVVEGVTLFQDHPLSMKSGNPLDDELAYIIQRSKEENIPGNSLPRVSLLTIPIVLGETVTHHEESPPAQSQFRASNGYAKNARSNQSMRNAVPVKEGATMDFLAYQSILLTNIIPTKEEGSSYYTVTVPLKEFREKGKNILQIFYTSATKEQWNSRKIILPSETIKYPSHRSMVLGEEEALDSSIRILSSNNVSRISSTADRQEFKSKNNRTNIQVSSSLKDLYLLWLEEQQPAASHRALFDTLFQWHSFSTEEKLSKYRSLACHEVNLFLKKNDFDFFQEFIRPLLLSKIRPDMLDNYLLDEYTKLQEFTHLYFFNQLNFLEQIFLLPLLPHSQATGFLSHLRARIESKHNEEDMVLLYMDVPYTNGEDLDDMIWNDRDSREFMMTGGANFAYEAPDVERLQSKRAKPSPFYQQTEAAKEVAEQRYGNSPENIIIEENLFWLEYAEFLVANTNTENNPHFVPLQLPSLVTMPLPVDFLLALAVIDLPLHSTYSTEDFLRSLDFAEGAAEANVVLPLPQTILVSYCDTVMQPVLANVDSNSILVHSSIFLAKDSDIPVQKEALQPGLIYGLELFLTKYIDDGPETFQIVQQIPVGAIPMLDSKYTSIHAMELEPFQTESLFLYFYFPSPGNFTQYPTHVFNSNSEVCGKTRKHGDFRVLEHGEMSGEAPIENWHYVKTYGSAQQIIDYLYQHPEVLGTNPAVIQSLLWIATEKSHFLQLLDYVRNQGVFYEPLWNYAILHEDWRGIHELLPSLPQLELPLRSVMPLWQRVPGIDETYQHIEFDPFIMPRVHRPSLALNPKVKQQYDSFLASLRLRVQGIEDKDILESCYYILLQGRYSEAAELFSRLQPETWSNNIHYQYMNAYLLHSTLVDKTTNSLNHEVYEEMHSAALRFKEFPVQIWADRFQSLFVYLEEVYKVHHHKSIEEFISVGEKDGERSVRVEPLDDHFVEIVYSGFVVDDFDSYVCGVSFFQRDLEVLFSMDPFGVVNSEQRSVLYPNYHVEERITSSSGRLVVAIPEEVRGADVHVEVHVDGLFRSITLNSNDMVIKEFQREGTLQVASSSNEPISACYVKVYVKTKSNKILFYKDGYTDLLGRFDYSSLTSPTLLQQAQQFSLFLTSERHGTQILSIEPPRSFF